MHISEFLPWLLATFSTLIFVSALMPAHWSAKVKASFRLFVAILSFVAIGGYWLTTGEKFDETAYRLVLCKIHNFNRCNLSELKRGEPSAPSQDVQSGGQSRVEEIAAERRRQDERERLAEEVHRREMEAERRRQQERERQRQDENRRRDLESQRRREEERERERQTEQERQKAEELESRRLNELARKQLLEQAERRRREQEETERRSRRFGATAVGKLQGTRSMRAVTFVDQASIEDAETRALTACGQMAIDCKVIAKFGGPGKCVYVAGGSSQIHEFGRVRRRTGATSAFTQSEALQKRSSVYQTCSVFHVRCNSSL